MRAPKPVMRRVASRIGIMIGFQTGPGTGGREGLEPRSRWFSVAKWHALAVRQVAHELGLAHVWSWGWAQRDARSNDPDKTYAACVWLWARDARLCDAPALLGEELDVDRTTGQLSDLPPGTTTDVKVEGPTGSYEYYCNLPGHKAAGMFGTLTVS